MTSTVLSQISFKFRPVPDYFNEGAQIILKAELSCSAKSTLSVSVQSTFYGGRGEGWGGGQ